MAKSDPFDTAIKLAAFVGLPVWFYSVGSNDRLPTWLQNQFDAIFAPGKTPGGPPGGQPPSTSGNCSAGAIQAWAAGISLPVCVGQAFCTDHGRLPQSIQELNSWGDANGMHKSDGSWVCPAG